MGSVLEQLDYESDNMNQYKEEWYMHTLNLPELHVSQKADGPEFREHMILDVFERYKKMKNNPLVATGEAFFKAYMISKIDGPLPVMDTLGMGYAIYESSMAWYDYFTS